MQTTPTSHQPIVSRKTLLTLSIIADVADIVCLAGLSPGPWSLLLDVPITIVHFLYGGPRAFAILAEYVPVVGALPCYTMAALFLYKHEDTAPPPQQSPTPPQSIDVQEVRTASVARPPATVIEAEIVRTEPRTLAVPPALPIAAANTSVEERLARLAALRSQQLITEEEFQAKRREILSSL